MKEWTAEIMTDPERDHQLHVELKEGETFRARLYEDASGQLQLRLYDGLPGVIPITWLLDIIARFTEDLRRQQKH